MSESGTTTAFFTSSRNAATPHAVEDGTLQPVPLDSVDNISPAGGIASNAADLARWLICRLDSGRYAGGRLFGERQAREMWSGQTILPIPDPPSPLAALRPNFAEYGLGWRLRDYQGRKIVSHTGGLAGMSSQITLVPAQQLGVVILTNSESDLMAALTYRLLDDLPGTPRPRADWGAAFAQAEQLARLGADSTLKATRAERDSASRPSLPLARYAGSYRDDLYGDATVALENDRLVLRFGRSPPSVGALGPCRSARFLGGWGPRTLEAALVLLPLTPAGLSDRSRLAAGSP